MYGSDEEVDDDTGEVDSDEDLSDDGKEHMHEEVPFDSFSRFDAYILVLEVENVLDQNWLFFSLINMDWVEKNFFYPYFFQLHSWLMF